MAIVYDKLMALKIPEVERTYTQRDPIFYALSLGLGQDPVKTDELPFVYEDRVKVLPTFPVVVAQPGFWARELDTGIDWVKVLHGEHDLVLHKPLPPSGTVTSQTRVLDVIDKGAGQGRADLFAAHGAATRRAASFCATITQTSFCRGDGGFGGPQKRRPSRIPARARAPDVVCDLATRPEMALLYRWNADMNPLHADPAIAKAAGLPAPDPAWARHLRRCRPRDPARRCAATIRRASSRSRCGSPRRSIRARRSAPRCGATARSSASARASSSATWSRSTTGGRRSRN